MLICAAIALGLSVATLAFGSDARALALFPWVALASVFVLDLALSMPRGLAVTANAPKEVFAGESVDLALAVSGAGPGLTARVEWPDGLTGAHDFAFTPGDPATANVPCQSAKRGIWRLDQLWLRWPSRLQFLEFVPRSAIDVEIRVVPNIRLVRSGQITTTVQSAIYGIKENRAIGEGSEFHQLQDFVQGMDVKTIDWKRSARRRSLVAKELRAERNHQVIIALDNGYLMGESIDGLPRIDHAITAALATAWAAAIGGDLVGYYAYDVQPRSFAKPEPGRAAFPMIRSRTAELDYVGRETNHTLALTELNARTPKRSLIIIFTDFVDTTSAELLIENIAILSKRHLVIFVAIRDPQAERLVEQAPGDLDGVATLVAANQALSERRLVFERLGRLGVTIIDAQPKAVTAQLISAYLEIKARDLI